MLREIPKVSASLTLSRLPLCPGRLGRLMLSSLPDLDTMIVGIGERQASRRFCSWFKHPDLLSRAWEDSFSRCPLFFVVKDDPVFCKGGFSAAAAAIVFVDVGLSPQGVLSLCVVVVSVLAATCVAHAAFVDAVSAAKGTKDVAVAGSIAETLLRMLLLLEVFLRH